MAAFLVVACYVVASYHRTAVASRRVAVPEQLHEVARRRFVPYAVGCPFLVGEVAFVVALAVAFGICSAKRGDAVAGAKFMHKHSQPWAVGIGASPESESIVLRGERTDVLPCLARDVVVGVPHQQGFYQHGIGGAGAERRLGEDGRERRPVVCTVHLECLVESLYCRF